VFGRDGAHPFTHRRPCGARAGTGRQRVPTLSCDLAAAAKGERELPASGRIGLHDARHTYCSTMIDADVSVANVSRYAGHSSAAFTLSRYVHARADQAP
jgi:integrase